MCHPPEIRNPTISRTANPAHTPKMILAEGCDQSNSLRQINSAATDASQMMLTITPPRHTA